MSKYKRLYKEEFTIIGIIRRAHGYKGHAKINIDDQYLEDLTTQQFVFIEIDGYKVPFRIEQLENKKDTIIKFKGCDSSEAMDTYQLHQLFLLSEDIKSKPEEESNDSISYVGMKIIDNDQGDIGTIIRVDEYPQQLMAILQGDQDQEIMIPLHDNLISQISNEDGIIYMDLPHGLI